MFYSTPTELEQTDCSDRKHEFSWNCKVYTICVYILSVVDTAGL